VHGGGKQALADVDVEAAHGDADAQTLAVQVGFDSEILS
jgi:hypothetical protein